MLPLTLKINKSNGFTLVEVLVTAIILSIGIVSATRFQSDIVTSSRVSKERVEALSFARTKMDDILHFSTAKQFESIILSEGGTEQFQGTTALYTATWVITKTDNTRGANVELKVSWGDDQSTFLTTIVSNTTPSAITLSVQAPDRDTVTDPLNEFNIFPSVNPINPVNSENICRCQGGVAVAYNSQPGLSSNFVRVSEGGGMKGDWYDYDDDGIEDDESSNDEEPITGATTECNLCCTSANAAANAENALKYYAKLEAQFMKKARYIGDQVLSSQRINPQYLIKGYQKNSQNNDIQKFLLNASEEHDWSSDDGIDDIDPATYDFTAACGINYDPPDAPTVIEPKPKPKPKSTRCIYYRNN
jgi:prepilin-type N-terminal cleavage/methylation domain-containing protein